MPIIGECEPSDGNRRREVRWMLAAALNDLHVEMTDRDSYSSVGLQYTEKFTSFMEVLTAMSLLPKHQRILLVRNVGPEKAVQEDLALEYGVSRKTVSREICRGLDDMATRIFGKRLELVSQMSQKSHLS